MSTCRALFLAGIVVMLASGPARAQDAPEKQSEPGEPSGEPDESSAQQGSQPGEEQMAPPAQHSASPPDEQPTSPSGDSGNPVTEEEQRILDDLTETEGRPWTEGVPFDKRKRAYKLFLEGNDIIKEGFFGKAADKYKEALALWEHPAFHYNLGIARMNLDQPVDAYERFLAARKHGPLPISEEKYRLAQKYLDLLRKQLGEIEVICHEPGAEVAVDGKPLFAGPGRQSVMVRPGGHRVDASKRGLMPDTQQVVLNPGDSTRVTVAPQIPEHLRTVRRWPQWLPLAVAGAGAVALAGASLMDWQSSRLFDRFDSTFDTRCRMSSGCRDNQIPPAEQAQLDSAYLWQWGARATYAVGGLTIVTSATLFYLNRERLVREHRLDDTGTVSLSPILMPHGTGVSAQLRF
jgi:hypothetical protein